MIQLLEEVFAGTATIVILWLVLAFLSESWPFNS